MIRKPALWLALIAVGALGASARAQAPAKFTLADAEALALSRHPQLQFTQLAAQAANQATRALRSAYFPFAYASSTVAGSDPNNRSRISAGGLNNPIVYNRLAGGLAVGQLLTDFGRTGNLVASSRLQTQAAEQNVQATRQAVLLAVDRAYYNALAAQAVLKAAEKAVEDRRLVADEVAALAQSKLKSALDVSFANVSVAQAKLDLVQDRNQVQSAFAALSQALGYAHPRLFQLEETPLPPPPPPDPAPLIEQAFLHRPELVSERLNVQSAEKFARAERDLWFPTVSTLMMAGLAPYRQKVSNLGGYYSAAGLNVSLPIFNGHLFAARRTEAQLKARQEGQRLRDLQDNVAYDVQVAWLNANTAYQRLALTRQLLDQANMALDLAQARYKLGLSSIVELSQAQLNETQAEFEQARAKYDYQIQIASLKYQTGSVR
jgi:outer membrane protein